MIFWATVNVRDVAPARILVGPQLYCERFKTSLNMEPLSKPLPDAGRGLRTGCANVK